MGKTDPGPAPTDDTNNNDFSFEMPEFEMPEFDFPDYAAINAKQQEDAERRNALSNIDMLYSQKFDAAERATAEVNQQISDESSHALTRGIDYSVSEQEKKMRINNVFANYWSEGSEAELTGLTDKWGSGDRVWDSGIERGTDPGVTGSLPTKEKKAGSAVKKVSTVLTDDKDKLGSKTVLGA